MNDAVAATLRAEMAARRMQRKELAEGSGIPVRTLSRYLDGEREISINTLARVAPVLGLTAGEIWSKATAWLAS